MNTCTFYYLTIDLFLLIHEVIYRVAQRALICHFVTTVFSNVVCYMCLLFDFADEIFLFCI